MSLNSFGMGFSLGLKDTGFEKGLKGAQQQAGLFQKSMDGIKAAGSGIGGVLKAAFRMPQIGPALGQIQSMANDYKITTTNVEALGIAADKVASQTMAGFNMSGKEARKWKATIASVSYGMNIDAGTVAKSFKAITQSGIDIKKVGFKNFTEFQKFLSVTGIDAEKFTATVKKLGSQFGMNDDQIKDTLTTVVALGKRFNVGAEAAESMSNTVSMLAEEGASLWAELGPDKTKKFLEGTQSLSIAFLKTGSTAQEAQDAALGIGRAMIKGRAGVQQLFSGLEDQLGMPLEVLTENLGGVDGAFQMLKDDPAKFAKSLAELAKKVRATAKSPADAQEKMARFSNQLTATFGPGMSALIGGSLDKTIDSFNAVEKELSRPGGLVDKNGVFGKIASNFKTGLTPTDELARAQDRFRFGLKALMHESDQDFLKRFNVSAAATSEKLVELSKQGGPLGKATAMMVEFSMHGLGGVASKISGEYGPAMAALIQQFGPVVQHLGAIVPAVMALMNPFTLVAGAVGLFYLYMKDAKEGGGAFKSFIDGLGPKILGVAKKIFDVAKVVLPKFIAAISNLFKEIDWKQVGAFVADMAGHIWDLFVLALRAAANLTMILVDMFNKIDMSQLANKVYDEVAKAVKWLVSNLPALLGQIFKFVGQIVVRLLVDLGDEIAKLPGLMLDAFKAIGEKIKDMFVGIFKWLGNKLKELWDGLTDAPQFVKNAIDKAKKGGAVSVSDLWASTAEEKNEEKKAVDRYKGTIDAMIKMGMDGAAKAEAAKKQALATAAKASQEIASGAHGAAKSASKDLALAGAAKELNMDLGDAASVIKAVAGMSPNDIKRSLTTIKTYYISFLKESATQSKTLLDDSRKYFNQFISDQTVIWSDKMVKMVKLFADAASGILGSFWSSSINQARLQSMELVKALGGAVGNMSITMGGVGSGSPVAAAPAFTQGFDASSGPNPLSNLVRSVNDPTWVKDMKEHMDKQSDKVVKAIKILTEVSNGSKAKAVANDFKSLVDDGDDNSVDR